MVVFLWWCFCGDVFVFLWWCFSGCVLVVVFVLCSTESYGCRNVLWGSVAGTCCEEVLWRSVVEKCCEGVVKWCRGVEWGSVV